MESSPQSLILMFGNDTALAYLIERYAAESGFGVTTKQGILQADDVCTLKPAAILFTSVESLEAAQGLVAGLANCDIPVLVCSSLSDEARARELGADRCLLHPLTYEGFHEGLAVTGKTGKPGTS